MLLDRIIEFRERIINSIRDIYDSFINVFRIPRPAYAYSRNSRLYLDNIIETHYENKVHECFSDKIKSLFDIIVYAPSHIYLSKKKLEERI